MPRVRGLAAEPSFDPRLLEDEDETGTADNGLRVIEFSHTARQDLEMLIQRAMTGTLPRIRELETYEPDKLNARHIQMIMMRAAGMKNKLIAEILDVSEGNVSVVLGHPDSTFILHRVLSYAAEQTTDISTRIKAHAGEALDTALHWMRHGSDRVASNNAFKLLEMAGYGAEEKKSVKHEVTIPTQQVSVLARALAESRDITPLSVIHTTGPGGAPIGTDSEGSSPEVAGAVRLPSSHPQDPHAN